jgi:CubicO group peptidase (beta-lactamase class C family)
MMIRVACFAAAALALLAAAPSVRADAVDEYVQAQMKKQKIPGLSLAVVRNGEVVKVQGYGLANVELNVPATAETVYSSGSVGKQFTSAAVMLLVEDGKIGLDDPIRKYLDDAPEAWNDITVRHLLTHTSGIKDYTAQLNLRKDYSDRELVEVAGKNKLDFPPGEQWRYSNTGYALVGVIIKKASGKFYGDILQERVFQPLGMATARIHSEADIIPNRAAGYRLVGGKLKNQEYVSPTLNQTADGSLVFSVLDMAKWDAGLYTEKVLKKSSLEQSWTPVTLKDGRTFPYGFGWALGDFRGHKLIEHGGAWLGFQTHIARYVDDKLTVIALANLVGSNPTGIAHGVAGFYEPALTPLGRLEPQPDPDPKTTERLKQLLTDLAAGKADAWVTEGFQADFAKMSAADRARTLRPLKDAKALTLLAVDDLSGRPVQRKGARANRLLHYRIEGGSRPVYVTFYLTGTGEVADVSGGRE